MSTLTIELPTPLDQQLQARGISQQQLQEVVTSFLQTYFIDQPPVAHEISITLDSYLAQLDHFSDSKLWELVKQDIAVPGLQTINNYDEAVLIRAKALALLRKRGHDLSSLKSVML